MKNNSKFVRELRIMKRAPFLLFIISCCWIVNSLHAQSPEPPLLETTKASALQFTIYPNPLNQGPLYIQCSSPSPKEVILYNVMGETVFQAYTQENTFDLSYLNTGIYLIRVTQDEKTGVQRLVIP